MNLNKFESQSENTLLKDLSQLNALTVNVHALDSNFKQVSSDRFYLPSEVNGKDGTSMLTGEKVDAHKALYDYEAPNDAILSSDPLNLLKNLVPSVNKKLAPIPVLISEGLRDSFSVDTVKNNQVLMETYFETFSFDIVGLMSKTGLSSFTERKVNDSFSTWGKSV